MARIRTIKPEFFTSEDIVSLSPLARLLYIAIWCEADKEGRLAWKPRTFKMRYLPGDDCDISQLCEELTACGLVVLYGDGLAHIPSFTKHQHVNPRESASNLPAPPGVRDSLPRKVGKTMREAILERDGYRCIRCSGEDRLQVDHILPQSCGGPHIAENLRTLCGKCNAGRPVAGKALDDDLAQDGFTVQSLRDKFGIDASIPDPHAQVGREGKGKEGEGREGEDTHTPLAPEWVLPKAWGEWAIAEYPHWTPETVRSIAEQFADHQWSKAATSADWPATWRKWCRDDLTQRAHPVPKPKAADKPVQATANAVPRSDRGAEVCSAAMREREATMTRPDRKSVV